MPGKKKKPAAQTPAPIHWDTLRTRKDTGACIRIGGVGTKSGGRRESDAVGVSKGIAAEKRRRNVEGVTSWTQRFSSQLIRYLRRLLQVPTSNLVGQNSSECCPHSPQSWDNSTRCPSTSLW